MAATFALRDARVAELSDEGMSEWAALADRALEPNPFNDPRFLVPAARTLPEAAELRVLFVTRGEQLVGAWAFTREKKYAGIPIPHLSTGGTFMVGTVPWRHPVVDRDDPASTLAAMLEGLAGVGLPGLLDLQHIPADGPLAHALAEAIRRVDGSVRVRSRSSWPLVVPSADDIPAPDAMGDVRALLSPPSVTGTRRKKAMRSIRYLEDAVGAPLSVEDWSDRPDAAERYMDLQAAGWKGDVSRGGAAMRVSGRAGWFSEMSAGFQASGHLIALAMMAGDRPLYISMYLQGGDTLYGLYDAYEEEFAKFSPGRIGRSATRNAALTRSGVRVLDPCVGAWSPEDENVYRQTRPQVSLIVADRRMTPRLVLNATPIARRGRDLAARAVNAVRGRRET